MGLLIIYSGPPEDRMSRFVEFELVAPNAVGPTIWVNASAVIYAQPHDGATVITAAGGGMIFEWGVKGTPKEVMARLAGEIFVTSGVVATPSEPPNSQPLFNPELR